MGQPAGKTNPTPSAEPAKMNPAGSVDRKNDIGSGYDGAIKAAVVPGAQWKGACRNSNCAVGGVVLINHTYAAFRESPSSRRRWPRPARLDRMTGFKNCSKSFGDLYCF